MRIHFGGGIAGEMLAAARDALPAQRVVEGAGQAHDLRDIVSVTAAAERIVGFVIERNVEHGTEIEIEPERAGASAR